MTKFRFMHLSALATLALALGLSALPAHAQDDGRQGSRRGGNSERSDRAERQPNQARQGAWIREEARSGGGERPAVSARQDRAPRGDRGSDWGGAARARADNPAQAYEGRGARAEAPAAPAVQTRGVTYGRNATYTAPRDRSYGATTRSRDWSVQRQARDPSGQQERSGNWAAPGSRNDDARRADGRNRGDDARRADWQRDRRQEARRDERRDDARNYSNGYRDGRRDDSRYGQSHRRWDNRGWRNDNRYDWYRYRASNRSLYSLGRYYAPHRGYSYSRISIGFRLGSPFYSNRYWINDPWQYRLPAVYGPYRWVRYYDDALLVDIYSGEVVDVIHNFFW